MCFAEQVGVNAPGRPKMAIFLPAQADSTSTTAGPMAQPSLSTSLNSCSFAAGSLSPTLIIVVSP